MQGAARELPVGSERLRRARVVQVREDVAALGPDGLQVQRPAARPPQPAVDRRDVPEAVGLVMTITDGRLGSASRAWSCRRSKTVSAYSGHGVAAASGAAVTPVFPWREPIQSTEKPYAESARSKAPRPVEFRVTPPRTTHHTIITVEFGNPGAARSNG